MEKSQKHLQKRNESNQVIATQKDREKRKSHRNKRIIKKTNRKPKKRKTKKRKKKKIN